jgi:hypothetical protein
MVLESLWDSLMFDDSSTSRAGGVLPQAEFIPKLSKLLEESPSEVIADFEEIRKFSKLTCRAFQNLGHSLFFSFE